MYKESRLSPTDATSFLQAVERTAENRDFTFRGFVADQFLMDELRAQYSALPPKVEHNLPNLALEIIDSLTDKYGDFIPEDTLDYSVGVVDRILYVTNDDYNKLQQLWYNPSREELSDKSDESAAVYWRKNGRIVLLREPPPVYVPDTLTEDEQVLLERFGGVAKAQARVLAIHLVNVLSHEIVHEYGVGLPNFLNEAGADYYATDISRDFGMPYGKTAGYGEKPRAFYAELVEKYGDDMHRLYFGSPIEPDVKQKIYAEFPLNKVKDLFPMWFEK